LFFPDLVRAAKFLISVTIILLLSLRLHLHDLVSYFTNDLTDILHNFRHAILVIILLKYV